MGKLSPKFKPSVTSYSAGAVAKSVRKVKVTPTANSSQAKIEARINGGSYFSVSSGSASCSRQPMVSTAQSGAKKTYSISIKRKSS